MIAWLVAVVLIAHASPALAGDRIDDLSAQISSSSEKTRASAVVSLGRLGDKRALRPLVSALQDPSSEVRILAAMALDRLGHKASLPALRTCATDDTDENVRQKAHAAAIAVAKANHMPDPFAAPASPAHAGSAGPQARHMSGFGRSPHAVEDRPDLYVMIKTSNDDSPGKADKPTRKQNSDIVRQALLDSFKQSPQVTMTEAEAQRWGLEARHLDVSVVKLEVVESGGYVEIAADLRLAISDDTGKMLSFLSGGAKVQVPRAKFKPQFLPDLRKEALEGAMHGLFDKLLAHLRDTSQS